MGMSADHPMRRWPDLPASEQLALREAYGRDPACLTGQCAMDRKIADFAQWLAARGVDFRPQDLVRR